MIRAYADNVIIRLEPLAKMSAGGLHLPDTQKAGRTGTREATVLAVGPGHCEGSRFQPTEVVAGERVLVDALAGQNYDMDLTVPRHNKPSGWSDEHGEFRIVREQEILAVIEREAAAE